MSEQPGPVEDTPQVTKLEGARRQAALGFIFATSLMDVTSLGIMIPVLPNLVKDMVGGDTATATHVTGLFAAAWGLMQFFCSPIQGMLSDRFGRRPVLLISIFGLSVDYMFMALSPNLYWLFLGRLINGMTAASFSTAGAYVADVTPPERRAKSFGMMGAAFSIGFVIGPAIGGWLGDSTTVLPFGMHGFIRLPFYAAATIGAVNWLYGLFVLPESLPKERRQPKFDWRRANPVGSFKLLRNHHELLGLSSVYALFQMAHNVFPAIFILYMGQRFGWGQRDAGYMLAFVGVVGAVVQIGLVGPAVKRIGERGAVLAGLASGVAGFLVYALAPKGTYFVFGALVFAFTGLVQPGLQGLMTRRVKPFEQGQLQGANAAVMGITAIFLPPVYTTLFALSIRHPGLPPGLPILMAAALILIGWFVALQVAKPTALPQAQPA